MQIKIHRLKQLVHFGALLTPNKLITRVAYHTEQDARVGSGRIRVRESAEISGKGSVDAHKGDVALAVTLGHPGNRGRNLDGIATLDAGRVDGILAAVANVHLHLLDATETLARVGVDVKNAVAGRDESVGRDEPASSDTFSVSKINKSPCRFLGGRNLRPAVVVLALALIAHNELDNGYIILPSSQRSRYGMNHVCVISES